MSDLLRDIAAQQLAETDSSVRLVVIHPNYARQHLLLQGLFNDGNAIYVRFNGGELNREQVDEQFKAALAQQQSQVKPAAYIVLDEADRATDGALQGLVSELLAQTTTARILLLTRRVPVFVQSQPAIRQQACFLPVSRSLMLADYARYDSENVLLEVRVLGSGQVMLNGRSIDDWDGTLPRALFFYLVDRGMTTRSQIFETFWPNLSTREATNVFHVTKRKISEVLGVDLTVYWSGFYRIAPNIDLQYDAALFTEMVQDSAVAEPDEAVRLLTQAVSLYQGEFLGSVAMEWVKRRRLEMVQTYGEALISLGRLVEQSGKPEEALGLYVRASATNRQREDLARNIMLLYQQLGLPADAVATYKRLEVELDNTLGVSPARDLQDLLARIEAEAEQVV
ncbi:MAG TPA: bacterial transcriptional activator domain-containing protein [Phototrophicaceae bacterium]|nr:bacterial transcriptional activator domain-containing protein [Phototrophicaceae bacterium]